MKQLLVLGSSVFIFLGLSIGTRSEKLVIDTDVGADDAVAILLVSSAWMNNDSRFEPIAITCVYGNTDEINVEQNVLKTLTIANASHIPVYGGTRKPLTSNYVSDNWFGNDGLGDFNFTEEITAEVDKSTHAAVALVNLAKKYKGELNILALGPLTNIAIAMSLDQEFVHNVQRFYIMGGSVAGVGNRSPGVEFNFGADPESNYIVLTSNTSTPSLLFPWETIINTQISVKWRTEVLGSIDSRTIKFLNQAENKILNSNLGTWRPSDAMAAATMIWPQLVKKALVTNALAVVDGAARGSLLIDYQQKTEKSNNVEIIMKLDVDGFLEKILEHFNFSSTSQIIKEKYWPNAVNDIC